MKNTKKRMEIFNNLSYMLYSELKLRIQDIFLSEFCMSLAGVKYNVKKNKKHKYRLYSINIFEVYLEIRCISSYLDSKSRKYKLTKKF